MTKHFYFYLTFITGVGGELITIIRMADWLVKNGHKVSIIGNDIVTDYLDQMKYNDSINRIFINSKRDKIKISPQSILITNAAFGICGKGGLFKGDCTILFYFFEPKTIQNQIQMQIFSRKRKNALKKFRLLKKINHFLELTNKKNALLYQDCSNYNSVSKYIKNLSENYLPIPLTIPPQRRFDRLHSDTVSFCYLGRNVASKRTTLHFYLKNLIVFAENNLNTKINFYIISDKLPDFVQTATLPKNLKLEFIGTIFEQKLQDFLIRKIDIMLATGISGIEAARLGLVAISAPVALIDYPISTPVPLIYQFKKYSMGGYLDDDQGVTHKTEFQALMTDILQNYPKHSAKCYAHAKGNFDIDTVMNQFLSFANKTTFTLDDWAEYGNTISWINLLRGVENNEPLYQKSVLNITYLSVLSYFVASFFYRLCSYLIPKKTKRHEFIRKRL